jgi:hypothetical protein
MQQNHEKCVRLPAGSFQLAALQQKMPLPSLPGDRFDKTGREKRFRRIEPWTTRVATMTWERTWITGLPDGIFSDQKSQSG